MQKLYLQNLDCANCAIKIEDGVKKSPGVRFARVDFATSTLFLEADDVLNIPKIINQIEPDIIVSRNNRILDSNNSKYLLNELLPIIISGFLFIIGLVFYKELVNTPLRLGEILIFGTAYIISGWRVLSSAARNISKGLIFDEHFLMSIATLGAIIIGEIPEAVGVMLFYLIGEFVQGFSVNRSRRSIQALLEIRPDQAILLKEGEHLIVKPGSVEVGDTIFVRPGDKIPLDGEIIDGNSQIDTSPLTGESVPKSVQSGDIVLAGSVNKSGSLTIKVIHPYFESSVHRIIELVENASVRKAKTEKFITKFAKVYSPIVFFAAIGVAIIPPLLGANLSEWIYRALVILVISCPCALVISIPLGYFGGVGGASKKGILVKGSNFLDVLADIKTVVFDKTGTLTKGEFKVTQVHPRNGFSHDELLSLAAMAEAGSTHPIAQSIREAYGEKHSKTVDKFKEFAGHGVQTHIDGRVLIAGNDPLLHQENIHHDEELCNTPGTVVHVAVDKKYAGCLVISDELKDDAIEAVTELRRRGVERIVMLTGDRNDSAKRFSDLLELDDFKSELLPEGKLTALEEILTLENNPGKTAFVGDGINDAPSLARADIGIAMGDLGSEAAIETSDVVIMTDSLLKISEAIQVGKKTRNIVWQNIAMALLVKGVFIGLGIAGEASMWQAVFGDMGVALLAVFNATRALK